MTLNLIDLNDYLGPSQLCTKPNVPTTKLEQQQQPSISKTQIQLDGQPTTTLTTTEALPKAQITLNDCLACSGCITSSESILVSLQSVQEVLKEISKPNRYPIISISSHSLASFVAYNQLDSLSTGFKVLKKYFTRSHNFKLVLDTNFAQHLHLLESQREFKHRQNLKSPVLASSCPAWICYAEKTQGKNGILEMISRVKSAQQIQGAIIKSQKFIDSIGVVESSKDLYHVCVMSCYDKKLEASRSDFEDEDGIKDVDCVLTTREVQDMIQQDGFDILQASQEIEELDLDPNQVGIIPVWIDHPQPIGSSSGGYLFNLLRSSIPSEGENIIDRLRLTVDQKRGSDYVEYRLQLAPPPSPMKDNEESTEELETLFYGAHFYGFKNLQNLIKKIGPSSTSTSTMNPRGRIIGRRGRKEPSGILENRKTYDFVEVMACPSGCLNGGGQIPIDSKLINMSNKQWISQLERIYSKYPFDKDNSTTLISDQGNALDLIRNSSVSNQQIFIQNWLDSFGLSSDDHTTRDRLFLTSYRNVEPESNGYAVQW
ncbi:hypothetical protein MJO28_000288 [Puccinia striiformis f. sp. tritici]|uniref:Uncharacterized protein n=1 Tax=Puccinia striiformis f. sp. tritici TaxID=168172 RepID=A0ACC0EZL1_9BASI|nr:hypothetical protein Pst134EA_000938 [Puccinia striiformis f. sp. tritici]KAH9473876.1 hypothetical protein Pst134EA_000938 [Puccinia striiformis f. sp. tritici]KAI7962194.1 hypothetical protein MJO28_000288 [Puccinia striiformis f. sp. tritici]KAI7967659.1 hypothetical protein MJO29_000936 [Puccinia striiformis f. sp. tritici]